jgi:hypothetical protein
VGGAPTGRVADTGEGCARLSTAPRHADRGPILALIWPFLAALFAVAGGVVSGPAGPYPPDHTADDPAAEVEAALAGLDEADPGAHADAFEAVNAAILAELRRLEAL